MKLGPRDVVLGGSDYVSCQAILSFIKYHASLLFPPKFLAASYNESVIKKKKLHFHLTSFVVPV